MNGEQVARKEDTYKRGNERLSHLVALLLVAYHFQHGRTFIVSDTPYSIACLLHIISRTAYIART